MDQRHNDGFPHGASEPLHRLDVTNTSSEALVQPPRSASAQHQAHPHGAIASHFLAQPPDTFGGQTWMDFLRESGAEPGPQPHLNTPGPLQPNERALPPLPTSSDIPYISHRASSSQFTLPARSGRESDSSSRSSADRKRRLTAGGEAPLRRPSNIRMHSGDNSVGGSSTDPIMLDSSSSIRAPPPLPLPNPPVGGGVGPGALTPGMGRRESEFTVPRWQPDSEVSYCFVCGSQFTFFFRKHHCRKCGRVVCSACSPHRITIPRQFIVHPPSDNPNIIDLTADDDDSAMSSFGPFRNPALGGGEEVRVCNPCVPDPNYSPPPPYTPGPNFSQFSPPLHPLHAPDPSLLHRMHSRGHRHSQSVNDSTQTVGYGPTPRSRDPFTDRRVSYHGSTRVADLWPPTQPPQHGGVHSPVYNHRARAHSRPNPTTTSSASIHPHPHPHPADGNVTGPGIFRRPFMQAPADTTSFHQPAPPRRQIAEEDECPICGNELPPKGLNDDESERIQHVEDCIALHSASPPPSSTPAAQTSTSLPSQRTRGMSSAATHTGNGEGASSSNRYSMSARGMYPYVATEKDAIDEEGNPAECVICFEEFEAGDKMARLTCWCKFHEACIRQWWDKKGRGACPTHQLQY